MSMGVNGCTVRTLLGNYTAFAPSTDPHKNAPNNKNKQP